MTESIDSKRNSIKVVGAHGGYFGEDMPVAFLLNESIAIDAGSLMRLGQEAKGIEHIFLTHAHFDHILSIPFLLDSFFDRAAPLKVYGLDGVLSHLARHIFNNQIWPDFSKISNGKIPALLEYCSLEDEQEVQGYRIKAVETDHTVESCGYVIKDERAILISGDTYYSDAIIEAINSDSSITTLLLECSYPSKMGELAKKTKHLTPKLVMEMVKNFNRDVDTYIYHIKPLYEAEVKRELEEFGLLAVNEGDTITF